jgi:hypothetical protein
MPVPYDEVDRYMADHLEESLADLERLVRIPVSRPRVRGSPTPPSAWPRC